MLPGSTQATRLGLPNAENEKARKIIEVRQAIKTPSLDLYGGASLATELFKRRRLVQGHCQGIQIRIWNKSTKDS